MVLSPCSVEESVDVAAGAAVQGQVDGDAGGARYPTMRKAVVALALGPPAMARAVIVRRRLRTPSGGGGEKASRKVVSARTPRRRPAGGFALARADDLGVVR
jgi:hypothetical protein